MNITLGALKPVVDLFIQVPAGRPIFTESLHLTSLAYLQKTRLNQPSSLYSLLQYMLLWTVEMRHHNSFVLFMKTACFCPKSCKKRPHKRKVLLYASTAHYEYMSWPPHPPNLELHQIGPLHVLDRLVWTKGSHICEGLKVSWKKAWTYFVDWWRVSDLFKIRE